MKVHVTIEADPRRWRRPRRLALLGAIGLLTIALPVALASHLFTDVATSNPHHDDISAIALAGVTTGCGPGVYCPEDNVTRQQMASFLRRGFGRVAYDALESITTSSANGFTASWTHQITPGLPSFALTGATGFIKTDAAIVVTNPRTDTGCLVSVSAQVQGVGQMTSTLSMTIPPSTTEVFALTGAKAVTSSGAKTIEVRVQDVFPCGGIVASGDATSTYFPFGSTGGNTLEMVATE